MRLSPCHYIVEASSVASAFFLASRRVVALTTVGAVGRLLELTDCKSTTDLGSAFAQSLASLFVSALFANVDPTKVAACANARALGSFQEASSSFLNLFDNKTRNLGLVGALGSQVHCLVLGNNGTKLLVSRVPVGGCTAATKNVSIVDFVDQVCGWTRYWGGR